MKKLLLLLTISLVSLSCSKDNDTIAELNETETQTQTQTQTQTPSKNLSAEQQDFLLEYEAIVDDLKWTKEISIFLDGNITSEYKKIVKEVLNTYNPLFSDGTKISLVKSAKESNVHLYNSTKDELASFWSDIYSYTGGAIGYGTTSWSSSSYAGERIINEGRIWVETGSNTSLLFHELGHVLGLGHSSQKYCSSSVMCGVPTAKTLSSFDKAMIKIRYHSDVKSDTSFEEMKPVIEKLLLNKEVVIE
ncbi:DUF2927 domain-containing protein [Tenacibaculum finnmarkense]|nr:DUF2927 domain-containing protein [Tenacibaculum finnmarkense]MBE7697309.1 DUF2927 domain-containing protein [Tenacibaculum finnmarkense genomovar ulcerans]